MKIKKYSFAVYIGTLMLLLSCQTPQQLYQKGNYDEAIQRTVALLRKEKVQEKDVITLTEAFNYVQTRDKEQVRQWQVTKNWAAALRLATQIEKRQTLVKPLLSLNPQKFYGQLTLLQWNDTIDQTIETIRAEGAAFYYDRGVYALNLAKKNQRLEARTAFEAFDETKIYIYNYKNVNDLQTEAYNLGVNHIYFKILNQSETPLPAHFETTFKESFLQDFDTQWVKYHTSDDSSLNYSYTIIARITNVLIRPEQQFEKESIYEKKIETEMEQDPNDTVRVKKVYYKTIRAKLHELRQTKSVEVSGTLEYRDLQKKETILSRPLKADALFENRALSCTGELEALPEGDEIQLVGTSVPFPSNEALLITAAHQMRQVAAGIITDYNHLISK